MIPIVIDTMDLSEEFSLTRNDVDALLSFTVEEITTAFARKWEAEVKRGLKSTRMQYINAIRVDKRGLFTGVAYLNPAQWLPNVIEMGYSAFDMKPGFLASPKAKKGKNTTYLTIPFRFATAGSLGESEVFAGVMPTVVAKAAKEAKSEGRPLSLGEIPSQHQIPKSASLRKKIKSAGFAKISANTKMTSKFEGMISSQGGYVTFRRVSENSDPDRFIHPGFEARDFAGKALNALDVAFEVDRAVDNFLVSLGFGE